MKVQYMSDLHLEFGDMPIPRTIGDVLVLAGDIGAGTSAVEWINEAADTFKHIIYICGNHEYYNHNVIHLVSSLKESGTFKDNVHFLDDECITLDGVKFAATTLWSNVSYQAFMSMNDSRCISYAGGRFTREILLNAFKASLQFLHSNADADVVITHHCPHINSIDTSRYPDDNMNTGYYTNILQEFRDSNVKHWICGHTHSAIEYTELGIQVHNNCRGYVSRYGKGIGGCEVVNFNPEAVFEVC